MIEKSVAKKREGTKSNLNCKTCRNTLYIIIIVVLCAGYNVSYFYVGKSATIKRF